ncbi:uncharacterized protein LOC100840606 isoform X1 [Brachypodium distachyon]|nr:uncharacterized protein LOC100840606 isoform X1 [Brachypodium distachyon]XP_024315697.1 uncharacterized protein LOC100840606 isoform X1 [Brachypodium distachyon]XP_024315698.1 uncharacterized protein LOC100840606 isoform X1 [Brachypodium distachyon]XP_024315699.1 uncharacterized protein LOC100840606 isoform X1 [Brachypodium distachyon]XP_024315700.1 uncharacterized protein LOC100840606 isoform X1 [Brachypodium distachyon]|eukprot:XP_010230378.1 uncharacterized protein LOC100840606 isoform X1 [Brachypodium distachyon]
MSEEAGEMARCRGAASLPDDDDLLREILVRLPPQPSSLVRASAVCKRWRGLATDPKFLQCFRARHGKPPLLGVFRTLGELVFNPILGPPDRISPDRFSLGSCRSRHHNGVLGCRHGRVLVKCFATKEVVVCEPISGEQRRVAVPSPFKCGFFNGAVVCAAGDQGHVHGGCHSSPFKVVLVSMSREDNRPLACVYSSETGIWGNIISTAAECCLSDTGSPGTLVGNSLYWLPMRDGILEFGLDGESLSVIEGPPVTDDFSDGSRQIIQAEDGNIGLVIFSYPSIQIWQRKVNCHGVANWLVQKTVDMHNILGLPPQILLRARGMETILGYAEDTDDIFIYVDSNVYMVQLKSMQSKRLHETRYVFDYHPFVSFYTPGIANSGGCDGAVMLHHK